MLKIAIYPSNHGFGHATRMSALAQELNNFGIYTFIRTNRPEYLFNNLNPSLHSVSLSATDFGVVHGDQLVTDLEATRSRFLHLMNQRLEIIDSELSFLRENEIDLVIADIPFLICEAASYAGIPVFAISNFEWYFIYKELFAADKELRPAINSIYGLYARVDKAYQLPFGSARSMGAFTLNEKVGLLARKKDIYEDIRKIHDLDPVKPVLLAFHSGIGDIDLGLKQIAKIFKGYVITNNSESGMQDSITISKDADMLDYIYHADMILTKPGYSTLAEAVQFSKPVLYRPRENYPEERVLIEGLSKYPNCCCVSNPKTPGWEVKAFIKKALQPGVKSVRSVFRNRNAEIAALIYQDFFKIGYAKKKLISVFDAGSNNLNYCVVDLQSKRVLHKTQLATGLGRNYKLGHLSRNSIRNFMNAFGRVYAFDKDIASEKRIIATGINRKAENIQVLKDLVKQKFNLKYGVISARDEAYYVFSAVRNITKTSSAVVAFDIGGNSTELIFAQADKLRKWVSMPVGLLKLIEPQGTIDRIIEEYAMELEHFSVEDVNTLVGVGLTVELVDDMLSKKEIIHGGWGRLMKNELEYLLTTLNDRLSSPVEMSNAVEQNLRLMILSIKIMILFMDRFAVREILVCKDGISVGYAMTRSSEI